MFLFFSLSICRLDFPVLNLNQSHFNNKTHTHTQSLPSYILCLLQYTDKALSVSLSLSLSFSLSLLLSLRLFSTLRQFIPSLPLHLYIYVSPSLPISLILHCTTCPHLLIFHILFPVVQSQVTIVLWKDINHIANYIFIYLVFSKNVLD